MNCRHENILHCEGGYNDDWLANKSIGWLNITGAFSRAVARMLIGGGCIFIYSGYARLTSFEINFISKGTSRAEPEYMNIHPPPPPINVLATALASSTFLV